MKRDIDTLNALHVCKLDLFQEDRGNKRGTIKTKSRSSNIMASWISNGTRSKGSCFSFPFTLGTFALDTTRELSGARTKDVSAINDESFWSTNNLVKLSLFSKCKKNAYFLNDLHANHARRYQYHHLLHRADVDDGVQTRSYL
jgi:hypothetical protein